MTSDFLLALQTIAQTIYDKKGMNILALDVRKISTITDFIVIAEGSVDRHVIAIAQAIIERLEEINYKPTRVEGLKTGDWVVIDCFDIMVHLFMPGVREKYRLEELWRKGEIVNLKIEVTPKINEKIAISTSPKSSRLDNRN